MDTLSDLVARSIKGKNSASPGQTGFAELVRKYQDMVFGLAYAILQDYCLAQDVTQESFMIAYEKLDTLIRPESFPFWLQQIARRKSLAALKRRRTVALLPESSADCIRAPGDKLPEEILERKESRQQIQAALNHLPEGQRIPVVLYFIDGYSQREIADFLQIRTDTVKKRIQRGRESMQRDLMGMFEKDLKNIRPSQDDRLMKTINLYTTLDAVAKTGQLDLVEQMLVDGVEINSIDAMGRTLLHWAVENDHVEVVKLLLKYGADRTTVDRSGTTAWQLAKKRKNAAMLRLFE
jgi:RNA polymerase sigma factor (sigma-70 family)